MVGLFWFAIACWVIMLIIDHSQKNDQAKLLLKENAEFNLDGSDYCVERIFESEDRFLDAFLFWLTGRYVNSADDNAEYVSIRTGGLDKVCISHSDGVRMVTVSGQYFSPEIKTVVFLQVFIYPYSIINKSDNPYAMLILDSGGGGAVFDEEFVEKRRMFYDLCEVSLGQKILVPTQLSISGLYGISDRRLYYLTVCREIAEISKVLEGELVRKDFQRVRPRRYSNSDVAGNLKEST